jgi:hypothetical protein
LKIVWEMLEFAGVALPKGHDCLAVRHDIEARETEWLIEGSHMPERTGRAEAPEVTLLFTKTTDDAGVMTRCTACWQHMPDVTWDVPL